MVNAHESVTDAKAPEMTGDVRRFIFHLQAR